ncbi:hypothetical protein OK016_23270 [Vibrio chagasii]|nr:hypothetical protein [Vibrio chagasii]
MQWPPYMPCVAYQTRVAYMPPFKDNEAAGACCRVMSSTMHLQLANCVIPTTKMR